MLYLAATGGGGGVQQILSRYPASPFLIGCEFPYNKVALDAFLGVSPIKYCSEETAMLMAKKCYQKSLALGFHFNILGVGITAVVATNRILKGDHRAHIAIYDGRAYHVAKIVFERNIDGTSVRGRNSELKIIDYFTCDMLSQQGIESESIPIHANAISGDIRVENDFAKPSPRCIQDKFHELYMPDGQIKCLDKNYILYPGSFNPLHDGHLKLANAAGNVLFMINDNHPDKGKLPEEEIKSRVAQFRWKSPVIITHNMPLFIDKARSFPGFTFLIGHDTYLRILDQKYSSIPVENMLQEFQELGTKFLVADRNGENITDHFIFYRLPIEAEENSTEIRNDNTTNTI